jgi:hypothetical protein
LAATTTVSPGAAGVSLPSSPRMMSVPSRMWNASQGAWRCSGGPPPGGTTISNIENAPPVCCAVTRT